MESPLYCGFCLIIRKDDLNRAVTIVNGQACCFDHMYYAQGAEFNRILAIIKLDEAMKETKKTTKEKTHEERIEEARAKIPGLSRFLRGS